MKKYYGIVEGFFSEPLEPWTYSERRNTINFINHYASNINTYFYCPKDDIYVTDKWDTLYPRQQLEYLKRLQVKCSNSGLTFIYGLNPKIQDDQNWENMKQKTIKKLNQVITLGCQNACLLFDDIPLAYDIIDDKISKNNYYQNLIAFINEIYDYYQNYLIEFFICLPDYTFVKKTSFTNACRGLNKQICICWSGNNIFTKKITQKDIIRVQNLIFPEVKLIYWSNYPVNDCEQALGTFNLGGFFPIDKITLKMLSGVIVNPMREVYANLPFYITFSEFLENKSKYIRKLSWNNALNMLNIPGDYGTILNYFSSFNIVDRDKPIIQSSQLSLINSNKRVMNKWGNKFVESTKTVFNDAKIYKYLTEVIREGKKIDRKLFAEWDRFPTKKYVTRYLVEILEIVKKRYAVYMQNKDIFSGKDIMIYYFNNKYSGSKKLNITKSDMICFNKFINSAIHKEQSQFIRYLENANTSTQNRILKLYKRRNINRFT